jgi:hypothetical protein
MAVDQNQLPYFNDSENAINKGYYQILFKPSVAVQARELTQLQSLIQAQIERMGTHFFKNGSRVLGGAFDAQDPIPFVRVTNSSSILREYLIGKELTGLTSGMKAFVIHAEQDSTNVGVTILYIRYSNEINVGASTTTEFTNESLSYIADDASTATLSTESVNITGNASIFAIQEGVLFTQGYFVKFDLQKIAVSQLTSAGTARVYFKTTFSVVDSNVDSTLLDNAQGFNNYNAPGADRLKCELTLVTSPITEDLSDDDHTLLIEVRDGVVFQRQERTQYNEVYDEIAKRTYDESGDYVIRGWDVFSKEHFNDGNNGGLYDASEGGDPTKLAIGIEKGLAYVKGYEVESLTTRYLEVDKSSTYESIDNQYTQVKTGMYIPVNEVVGLPEPDDAVTINLYDTAQNGVTTGKSPTDSATGSIIGTCFISSYVRGDGVLGTSTSEIYLLCNEFHMNSGYGQNDIRSMGDGDFYADTILDANGNVTKSQQGTPLQNQGVRTDTYAPHLMPIASKYVRSLTSVSGSSDTSLIFQKKTTATAQTNGTLSITDSLFEADETFPYGTGTIGVEGKRGLYLVVTEATGATTGTVDTVSVGSSNNIVTGSGTSFTKLNVGDTVVIATEVRIIESIESDESMTLTADHTAGASGVAMTKFYQTGSIIDLNTKGHIGGIRTVTSSPTSVSIDLEETFTGTFSCDVIHRVVKYPVTPIPKVLKPDRFVKIDVSNNTFTDLTGTSVASLTKFSLGVSDVYRIKSVRQHTSAFTTELEGTDVSDNFVFVHNSDNSSYKNSYIRALTPVANTNHLLIKFDYFDPDYSAGDGYFCIDSYPIDDANTSDPTTIQTANIPNHYGRSLRSLIDTRPMRTNIAADSTTVTGATENPAESTAFNTQLRIPVPGSSFIYDYSYYVSRRDVLCCNKAGEFIIVTGEPAKNPPFPRVSDSVMKIANLFIPPYPSLSGTYARILGMPDNGVAAEKVTFSRHTMRDIGRLKKRVKDLEYYNSLSLMESSVSDLTIPDENGIDRFKNGTFIDPFGDHSLADSGNRDYKISVDKKNKEIRPIFDVDGFDFAYKDGSGVALSGDLVTLDYTEKTLIEQLKATTTRNIEFSAYRFIGVLNLFPDIDTWCDITTVDKTIDLNPNLKPGTDITTDWNAPTSTTTGATSGAEEYKVYLRYYDEADPGSSYPTPNTLGWKEIANRLGLDISLGESVIDTLPNLYSALTPEERANRIRGTFDTMEAALAWIRSSGEKGYGGQQRFFIYRPDGEITTTEQTITTTTGTETTVTVDEELTEIGEFVTDASIMPYIRPQTIKLVATGLKRTSRYHIFFDGENMNNYCRSVLPPPNYTPASKNVDIGRGVLMYKECFVQSPEGEPVYSDEYGNVVAFLRLPKGNTKRFRTGESEVVITDNPTNDKDASSYAIATFISAGLKLQKQRTILSTKTSTTETKTVTKTETITETSISNYPQLFQKYGPSCMGYSFYVDEPASVEGVMLTSVDVWINQLSATLGVWFELREMSSDGGVTRNTVPYSTVWMYRDDPRLKLSTDGIANPTNVNFPSPIFLYNKTQYAFIIHTEGLNPDTYFWISKLGGVDVNTNNPVTSRPLTGTTYTTNNNLNWDIVPDVDLKCRFNRADFGGSVSSPATGTVQFGVEDVEFVYSSTGLETDFFEEGESIRGSDILSLNLDSSNSAVGDTVLDPITGANGEIQLISGDPFHYIDGFDFQVGQSIQIVETGNTGNIYDTGTVSAVKFGTGVVDRIVREEGRFDIINSNGLFWESGGCVLRSFERDRHNSVLGVAETGTPVTTGYSMTVSTDVANFPSPYFTGVFAGDAIFVPLGRPVGDTSITAPTHTIDALLNFDYTSQTFRPNFIEFEDTSTDFSMFTTSKSTEKIGSYARVRPEDIVEYNEPKTLISKSNEYATIGPGGTPANALGTKSCEITTTLSSTSSYVSPIIDTSMVSSVCTMNMLNANTDNETNPYDGALSSKYISQVIYLDTDNQAEDLLVILDEYRPAGTDVIVWARIRNEYDPDTIYEKDWVLMDTSKSIVSSSTNKRDYIEISYKLPFQYRTGPYKEVQYYDSGWAISAEDMVSGNNYVIVTLGENEPYTDFTLYGASNNDIYATFTANNVGTGTGYVYQDGDVEYTSFSEFQIKIGLSSSNEAVYPKASKLRAIALQV